MSNEEERQELDGDRARTGNVNLAGMLPSGKSSRQHVYVVVQAGQKAGAVYRIGEVETTLGRSPDCDIALPDEGVSRTHAKLIRKGAELRLLDMDSTNGTFVDRQRIDSRELSDGDRFELGGGTLLKVFFGDELEETLQRGLYESSVRDWLTGLYNQRYLEERLEAEFSFAQRHKVALSFLLVEFEGIELIHEASGRKAGEDVLREVATAVGKATRSEDVVARTGGQEVAVLARQTAASQAQSLAERIRAVVEALQFVVAGAQRVTLSIGVACQGPTTFTCKEELVEEANRALIAAKRQGRDQIVCLDTDD